MRTRFLLLLLCCLILIGCLPRKMTPPEKPPGKITLIYTQDSLLYLPLYAVLKKNYDKKHNFNLELQKVDTFTFSEETAEHLLYLGGPEEVFYGYQQEKKLGILSKIAAQSGHLLLSRSSQETSWPEMKNRVIISAGSGKLASLALEYTLRKHNLKPFLDLHLINNLPEKLRPAVFQSGSGQFILIEEPGATLLEQAEAGFVIKSIALEVNNLPTVFFTTKKQYFPETYQAFNLALQAGLELIAQQTPEEIANWAVEFFPGSSEKTLIRGICRYKTLGCWPTTPEITSKELKVIQQLLLDTKELTAPLPLAELLLPKS